MRTGPRSRWRHFPVVGGTTASTQSMTSSQSVDPVPRRAWRTAGLLAVKARACPGRTRTAVWVGISLNTSVGDRPLVRVRRYSGSPPCLVLLVVLRTPTENIQGRQLPDRADRRRCAQRAFPPCQDLEDDLRKGLRSLRESHQPRI